MKKIYALLILLLAAPTAFSQLGGKLKDGLKFYTDAADSSRFIKLNMTNQLWARYTDNNPQTTVMGKGEDHTTDISIRRIRAVLSGQLTDRVAFFVQFGQNSFNYLSGRKAGSFFHDVTADYAVIKKRLSLGFGLNGWNGPSRFANISVASIMPLDPPGYQEATNDTYDQFVRRMGVYAKGKLGKLDYRLSAGKPFVIQTAGISGLTADPTTTNSAFSTMPPNMVYQGYLMYQFLDQESNFGPSNAGTYLGSKRIFNIGGGFYYQKNAMFKYIAKDTSYQDILLYAVDIMYDAPLNKEKGTAISLYGCYSNYNYGTNFIKVSGPDNPANGSSSAGNFGKANYGNAFPYLGTGSIYYAQAGYKFKNNLLKSQGTLQLYADCQYAVYKRLNGPMTMFDAGINWLIRGYNAKFTLNYQNRPYFATDASGALSQKTRKGSIVLQYQLAF